MSNPFGGFNVFSDIANAIFEMGSSAWQQDKAGDMLDHAQNFSRSESALNRDFQERMRATQYQTAVGDMKSAGLNPMLAYQQGGSGTPSGSMASSPGGQVAQRPNLSATLQTAAQVRNIEAQTRRIETETNILKDEFGAEDPDRIPATYSNRLKKFQGTEAWYRAQVAMRQANLTDAERERVLQHIKNLATQNRLDELDIPKAINEAKAQETDYMKYVAPFTGELGKATNSAEGLARILQRHRMNKYIIHGN